MAVQGIRKTRETLLDRCIYAISPTLSREKEKLNEKIKENDTVIQSYADMSKQIQDEVEQNHFSPYLVYEKVNK